MFKKQGCSPASPPLCHVPDISQKGFCLLCPLFTCSTTFSVGEVTCLLSQSTSPAAAALKEQPWRSPHAHFAEPPASKVPNNLQNPLKFIAITCVAHQGTGRKKSVPSSNHTNSYRGHSGVLQSTSQLPSSASAVSSHPPAGSWPASVSAHHPSSGTLSAAAVNSPYLKLLLPQVGICRSRWVLTGTVLMSQGDFTHSPVPKINSSLAQWHFQQLFFKGT